MGVLADIQRHKADRKIKLLEAEIAAKEKTIKHLSSALERARAAKNAPTLKPVKRAKLPGDKRRYIFGDMHGIMAERDVVQAVLEDIKLFQPHEIVLLGDMVNCGGFLAQHHVMGYVAEIDEQDYESDIKFTNHVLDELAKSAPNAEIHYLEGNHECLTPDHEVLTKDGWIPISEVTTNHEVASLGHGSITEWQNPTTTIKNKFNGELICVDNPSWSTKMTPGHRICYYGQYMGDIKYSTAQEAINCKRSTRTIPVSALGSKKELTPISDNEIRLVGWILTDGCISQRISIFQSKPHGIQKIKNILDELDIEYTFSFRKEREIKPINGVKVKSSLPQGVFNILSSSAKRILNLFEAKDWSRSKKTIKKIPSWVSKLSQRQFEVLLSSISDGDGHPTSDIATSIYGTLSFLTELQKLCVVNGIRALLRSKTRKGKHCHWVLYTKKNIATKIETKNLFKEQYDGDVHCLVMPNQNFFVRRNGVVHVTGNCRVERWAVNEAITYKKNAEFLVKHFAPRYLLSLRERGINYYSTSEFYHGLPTTGIIKLDKCYFTHGTITARHSAAKMVAQTGGCVVFGHTHRKQEDTIAMTSTGPISAWSVGCTCKLAHYWHHSSPMNHSHGAGVQIITPKGNFMHINYPFLQGNERSLLPSLFDNKP